MIGVLALQGAFSEHINVLKNLNQETIEIRNSLQLSLIDALILPGISCLIVGIFILIVGGESTTMALLMKQYELIEPLKEFINSGKPVWVNIY